MNRTPIIGKPSSFSRRSFIKASATTTAVGLVGWLAPISLATAQGAAKGIIRQAAPELEVPYWIDGKGREQKPFSIQANRGKWIYLKCFQHWCPGCHSSGFPGLQKLVSVFPKHEQLAVAAIQTTFEGFSINNQAALRKNQLRYQLDIPFGHDSGDASVASGDVRRYPNTMVSYRTGGTPWIILVNPQGKVVFNDYHVNTDKLIEFLSQQFS